MRETEPIHKDRLSVVAEAPVMREQKFLGSKIVKPGHTMYKLHVRSGKIFKAQYEATAQMNADGTVTQRKKLVMEKGCLYESALNVKNVKKKFLRIIGELQKRSNIAAP